MWEWMKQLFRDSLGYVIDFFKDVFVWCLEAVFFVLNFLLGWLLDFLRDFLVWFFDAVKEYIPSGLVAKIVDLYQWIEYVNDWIPLDYGIRLFIAYYSILSLMTVFRWCLAILNRRVL